MMKDSKNSRGATLTEYTLLVALISVVAIVAIFALQKEISCALLKGAAAVTGQDSLRVAFNTPVDPNHICDFNHDGKIDSADFVGFRSGLLPCCTFG